jgi:Rieske Fe-S protein
MTAKGSVLDVASTPMDRRTVLRGAAIAGCLGAAAPVLAACGSDDSSAAQPTPTSPTTSAPDVAPGATSSSGVVVPAGDVPVGGGAVTIIGDRKIVVTQPSAGTYQGFSAVCPHQGCTVSGVQDGAITCPCHGSRFDVSTGAVLQGPAAAPLASIPVALQGDDIVFA